MSNDVTISRQILNSVITEMSLAVTAHDMLKAKGNAGSARSLLSALTGISLQAGAAIGVAELDDQAVDAFAERMKKKLAKAREAGRNGWQDKTQVTEEELQDMLIDHLYKGDPVDVANFCMFLGLRNESVNGPTVFDYTLGTTPLRAHDAWQQRSIRHAADKAELDKLKASLRNIFATVKDVI